MLSFKPVFWRYFCEFRHLGQGKYDNVLAPKHIEMGSYFKPVISKHILRIEFPGTSFAITFRWMPQNTFEDKSILVPVMAWCRQAASHYLSQCCRRSMTQYGITKPLCYVLINHINPLRTIIYPQQKKSKQNHAHISWDILYIVAQHNATLTYPIMWQR